MFQILTKTGNSSDNLWSFYTENGLLYSADTAQIAADKIQTLAVATPIGNFRLVQNVDIQWAVTAAEEGTEPPTTPDPEEPDPEE